MQLLIKSCPAVFCGIVRIVGYVLTLIWKLTLFYSLLFCMCHIKQIFLHLLCERQLQMLVEPGQGGHGVVHQVFVPHKDVPAKTFHRQSLIHKKYLTCLLEGSHLSLNRSTSSDTPVPPRAIHPSNQPSFWILLYPWGLSLDVQSVKQLPFTQQNGYY